MSHRAKYFKIIMTIGLMPPCLYTDDTCSHQESEKLFQNKTGLIVKAITLRNCLVDAYRKNPRKWQVSPSTTLVVCIPAMMTKLFVQAKIYKWVPPNFNMPLTAMSRGHRRRIHDSSVY